MPNIVTVLSFSCYFFDSWAARLYYCFVCSLLGSLVYSLRIVFALEKFFFNFLRFNTVLY